MDIANGGSASAGGAGTSEFEDKDAYTVGWICALPLEMAAANLMLDKIYDIQIEQDNTDHNSYILGLMRGHNVVIACLPDGDYGTTPAATVAKDMLRTFKSIRFGLLVGVGGGAPSSDNDIRLGDVVVSKPTGTSGGVIQYDRGKTTQHEFERTGSLNAPPNVLLTALSRLQARQAVGESDIPQFLSEAAEKIKKPKIRQKFTYQGESNDGLFQAEYEHVGAESNCDGCDPAKTMQRDDRDDTDPVVHYGNIASGNQVIKHGKTRDRLSKELGVLCFEMEAAGLMQEFPCLVIRGICDYSDAHKNKRWQEYAATTAAAFAKELLSIVSPGQVKKETKIILDPKLYTLVSDLRNDIRDQRQEQEAHYVDEKNQDCLRALSRTDSFVDKEHILGKKGKLLRNSCRWIIDNPQFKQWRNSTQSRRLWIKGDPGKGKTMLLCGLIEELENSNRLCYFFCQATEERLRTANAVLRGLILHLVRQYPKLISHVRKEYDNKYEATFEGQNAWLDLCKILESMLEDEYLGEVLIIVDALDECKDMEDRKRLLRFICKISTHCRAKLIVSSRNWPDIQMQLGRQEDHAVTLSLELNADSISDAVHSYIDHKMEELAQIELYKNNTDLCGLVRDHLIHNAKSTFLWVALVCQELSGSKAKSPRKVNNILNRSPSGLDDLYARMIEKIFDSEDSEDSRLCMEILAVASVARRPVTLRELFHTLPLSLYQGLEPEELKIVIECCGSFLNMQEDTIYFVHQSALDFLHTSASKLPSISERHQSVFWNSLKTLLTSDHVKRDIYDIEAPAMAYEDIKIPQPDPLSALQYSTTYWVDHLADWITGIGTNSTTNLPTTIEAFSKIQSFLQNRFLYWIEMFALHGQMRQAMQAVQKLQTLVNGKASNGMQELAEFVNDANRFLRYHKPSIEEFPLQLYGSALVFSPESSIVRNHFSHEAPERVKVTQGIAATWDACLQTLSHSEGLGTHVAYSPDGQWLVSGSDKIVKLWDAETGTCIRTIEAGVQSLAFLGASNSIVALPSAGSGRVVKIFDRVTGECVSEQSHPTAKTMAISPDGSTIASWFSDQECISVWDVKMETPPRILNNIPAFPYPSSLSVKGQWLASDVKGGTVIVWNTSNGDFKQIYSYRQNDFLLAIAWSNDAEWIACGAHSVQIWDPTTGQCLKKFSFENGAGDGVLSMAFSADKRLLAVMGTCLYVLDTTTGALKWAIQGYGVVTFSMTISPDARRLVTPMGGEIKVWDLSMGDQIWPDGLSHPVLLRYTDDHHFAVFDVTSSKIILRSNATAWDIHVQAGYPLYAMTLSGDNRKIAAASFEGRLFIWDTKTGSLEHELNASEWLDTKETESEQSEPHDKISTNGSEDSESKEDTRNVSRCVPSMVFINVTQLALCTNGILTIVNASDGTRIRTIHDEGNLIRLLTASGDGRWLAYLTGYSRDTAVVKIWNVEPWQCTSTFALSPETISYEQSSEVLVSLSLSHSGRYLAVASDHLIDVWDLKTGAQILLGTGRVHGFHANFDSKVETCLHTEYGSVDFAEKMGSLNPDSLNSDFSSLWYTKRRFDNQSTSEYPRGTYSFSGYGFCDDPRWISLDGERLLFLPSNYRPVIMVNGDLISYISGSSLTWISGTRVVQIESVGT